MKNTGSSENSASTQGWFRALIFIPAYITVLFLAQLLAFPLIYIMPDWDLGAIEGGMGGMLSLPFLLITQVFVTAGGLSLVGVFTRYLDQQSFSNLGFRIKGFKADAALGFGLGIGLIGLGFLLLFLAGYIQVKSLQIAPLYLLGYGIFTFLVAISEEVVVRGYVLNNLMNSLNKWIALLLSALFFMLLHSFNPGMGLLPILNLFMAGLLLGVYYLYFKNLWFPIMLHLSWNFFQGAVFGFEVSGVKFSNSLIAIQKCGPDWLTGGMFGFEGSLLLMVLNLLVFLSLIGYFERKKKVTNLNGKGA